MWITRDKGLKILKLWRDKPELDRGDWNSMVFFSFIGYLHPGDVIIPDDWDGSPFEVEIQNKTSPN